MGAHRKMAEMVYKPLRSCIHMFKGQCLWYGVQQMRKDIEYSSSIARLIFVCHAWMSDNAPQLFT